MKTWKIHCWSHLSALFWLSKIENIVETLVVLNSLNGYKTISTQYTFTPFSGWDRLFMKKEYLSLSWLRGYLRHSFLPFRIYETTYEKGMLEFYFLPSFQTLWHEKTLISPFVRLVKPWWHWTSSWWCYFEFLLPMARKMY